MALTTFKIGKKEFVVLPKKRYEELTRAEQDEKDAKIAAKAIADWKAGKLKTVTLAEARKRWGV